MDHHLPSLNPATSAPIVAHNTPARAPVNCAESLFVPPCGTYTPAAAWLTAESVLGRVREAHQVRAAIISGEPCAPAAVAWLEDIAGQTLLKSAWAAELLNALKTRGLA